MSRDEGFAVMDVSTDIVNDPKVRKMFREAPDHAAVAFTVYIALLAESWKAGRRVPLEDAWPAHVPMDGGAVKALYLVGLLDKSRKIANKSWNGWFEEANKRRTNARERWKRANANRGESSTNNRDVTARLPREDRDVTASTVPLRTVPSVPTVPSVAGAREGDDGQKRRRNTVDDSTYFQAVKAAITEKYGPDRE